MFECTLLTQLGESCGIYATRVVLGDEKAAELLLETTDDPLGYTERHPRQARALATALYESKRNS